MNQARTEDLPARNRGRSRSHSHERHASRGQREPSRDPREIIKKRNPDMWDHLDRQRREQEQNVETNNEPRLHTINTISGGPASGDSRNARDKIARYMTNPHRQLKIFSVADTSRKNVDITFMEEDKTSCGDIDGLKPHFPLVIVVANHIVKKVLVDTGSSANIIFANTLRQMDLGTDNLQDVATSLVGFGVVLLLALILAFLSFAINTELSKTQVFRMIKW